MLKRTDSLRYSQLLPDHIESSHFKYHLDSLIKNQLVEKISRGKYKLSDKGKSFVDKLSEDRINPKEMPKVITYTLLYNKDYYYLQSEDKEPYRGLLNLVGGKMHLGETALEASKREIREKLKIELYSRKKWIRLLSLVEYKARIEETA